MRILANLRKRWSADPVRRRRAWSKFYQRRLARHNLHMYKSHLNWTISPELTRLHREWGDLPGIPADRCYLLYAVGRLIAQRGIEGDTAECGVRYGKGSFFFLSGLAEPARRHHLFDSFAGLPEVAPIDRAPPGLRSWQAGDIAASEEVARRQLARFTNCEFHVGWIPEPFEAVAERSFAFVHVDVDLHRPTLDTLEFFWPRLVPGGLLVCDDYGFASCPGATRAVDDFFAGRPECVLPIPSGQCLVWKL